MSARGFLESSSKEFRTEDDMWAFELFGNMYVMSGQYKAIKVRKGMYGDGEWHLFNVVDDLLLGSGRLGSARGELPAEATLLSVTHDTELVLLVRAALLEEGLQLLLGSLQTTLELNSLRVRLEILLHDSDVDVLG